MLKYGNGEYGNVYKYGNVYEYNSVYDYGSVYEVVRSMVVY